MVKFDNLLALLGLFSIVGLLFLFNLNTVKEVIEQQAPITGKAVEEDLALINRASSGINTDNLLQDCNTLKNTYSTQLDILPSSVQSNCGFYTSIQTTPQIEAQLPTLSVNQLDTQLASTQQSLEQINQITSEIDTQLLPSTQTSLTNVQNTIATLPSEIDSLNNDITSLNQKISEIPNQLTELTKAADRCKNNCRGLAKSICKSRCKQGYSKETEKTTKIRSGFEQQKVSKTELLNLKTAQLNSNRELLVNKQRELSLVNELKANIEKKKVDLNTLNAKILDRKNLLVNLQTEVLTSPTLKTEEATKPTEDTATPNEEPQGYFGISTTTPGSICSCSVHAVMESKCSVGYGTSDFTTERSGVAFNGNGNWFLDGAHANTNKGYSHNYCSAMETWNVPYACETHADCESICKSGEGKPSDLHFQVDTALANCNSNHKTSCESNKGSFYLTKTSSELTWACGKTLV